MSSPNTTTTSPGLFSTTLFNIFTLKSLYPSPLRPITPRSWFLPLTTGLFISTSLLSRSTRIRIFVPVLLLVVSQTRATSTGDPSKDFSRACIIFMFLNKFVDFGMGCGKEKGEVFRVDEREGKKEGSENVKVNGKGRRDERSVWKKLRDGADLYLFNMRGIGWNWEVGGIPKREEQSHSYFLLRTTLRLIGTYLLLDLCKTISSTIPYIQLFPRPTGSFFALPMHTQILLTWLHQLEAFCVINLPYQLFALIFVSLKLSPQSSWPPLFGSLSDAYLVSRTWGRTWHQLARRNLGLLTPHMQCWLGAKSRGAKRTVSLFSSFFLSGLAHWVGAFNLPWTASSAGMFGYFMMQAPVVRVEDWVVEWGERKGVKLGEEGRRKWRVLGYIWTFAWISWSMRYAAAYQFESGPLSRFEPMKGSLLGFVRRVVS